MMTPDIRKTHLINALITIVSILMIYVYYFLLMIYPNLFDYSAWFIYIKFPFLILISIILFLLNKSSTVYSKLPNIYMPLALSIVFLYVMSIQLINGNLNWLYVIVYYIFSIIIIVVLDALSDMKYRWIFFILYYLCSTLLYIFEMFIIVSA